MAGIFFWICPYLLILLYSKEIGGSKIIAVEFMGSKSHVLTYLPLVEQLARNGHQVTLASPLRQMAKDGVREVPTIEFQDLFDKLNLDVFTMKEAKQDLNPFPLLRQWAPPACSDLYDRPDIRGLMAEPFDLIILQPLFNECSLGFVHTIMTRWNASLILFSTTSAPSFLVQFTGGHHPPSFVPGIFTGFRDQMGYWERVQNLLTELFIHWTLLYYYIPTMEEVYRNKLGEEIPSVTEILGSASLILSNGHFSINRLKPNLPNVIDVGGLHSQAAKPLPKELEDFVAGGTDGFILVSFGTGIRGSQMPTQKKEMFIKVFSTLKQRVIWKYDVENTTVTFPKNVLAKKWLPQQDLLGHSKIKMFITHCGLGGMEEAIYHGVPLLGIPFFGDQPLNAKEGANHGFLLPLDWNTITETDLQNGIEEVLQNPQYRQSIRDLSAVFKDQIDSPLQRAVWWSEYVIRHKGAPKLQSIARKLTFIQYHSIDVVALLGFVVFIIFYALFKLVKIGWSRCFKRNDKKFKKQ